MDDTDRRLVSALRRDGRAALSDLAATLGVSRATVRDRLRKLVERGEIVGFTALLKDDVAQAPVRGLMMLGIEGRGTERTVARLLGIPQVQAVHATNGKWDLIVEIGTDTLEALDRVLATVRRFDGVALSETSLLLSTRKPARLR
ncbi:AsnC family transcriptional regulator [Maritimibacter sp. 55A14]|uniref:Lrp/AsnC family transcriptional regulator n=1 Tax=Maritimibacter sp. 55A14 TaxID=2174844 RepID=UPI000D615995|nr:Lrp/AsnC family transcriptional regulator [Maritimibacter sp. 55A14]PWE34439.1 AsnC family transcriptional regulator [Maritimibacter sp. 55A14]